MGHVPGNSFPFPVGVGSQVDFVGLLGFSLQFLDGVTLPPDGDVFWLVVVFNVDPHLGLGQVPDVPFRGDYVVLPTQVLLDSVGLGWRFHDNQVFFHLPLRAALLSSRGLFTALAFIFFCCSRHQMPLSLNSKLNLLQYRNNFRNCQPKEN